MSNKLAGVIYLDVETLHVHKINVKLKQQITVNEEKRRNPFCYEATCTFSEIARVVESN